MRDQINNAEKLVIYGNNFQPFGVWTTLDLAWFVHGSSCHPLKPKWLHIKKRPKFTTSHHEAPWGQLDPGPNEPIGPRPLGANWAWALGRQLGPGPNWALPDPIRPKLGLGQVGLGPSGPTAQVSLKSKTFPSPCAPLHTRRTKLIRHFPKWV